VSVRIPKVRSKDGTPVTFRSALVTPLCAQDQDLGGSFALALPQGHFQRRNGAALKVLLGPDATGLSANTVSRLKHARAKEYDGCKDAAFDDEPIVYIWPTASTAAFAAKVTGSAHL
jgi:hypothetical protein